MCKCMNCTNHHQTFIKRITKHQKREHNNNINNTFSLSLSDPCAAFQNFLEFIFGFVCWCSLSVMLGKENENVLVNLFLADPGFG